VTPPYHRTVCACAACVACCKQKPGFLIPRDLHRITRALALPTLEAARGVLSVFSVTVGVWHLEALTPRLEDDRCVFLGADDRCRIHAMAPYGCAYFDMHQSFREWFQRTRWGMEQLADPGPDYRGLVTTLRAT
jgi:Fe-S-cluster containining protein